MLMPVADKSHWTLLVTYLKSLAWIFFDSFPNLTHRAILPDVVGTEWYLTVPRCLTYVLSEEDYFGGDIRNWPLSIATRIPTQTNGFDCGIFVCKYMEATILPRDVKWEE
ncbi:hypothetical protein IEQ34_014248 [Dendrobium chrysotoxum]|uniref:Ubiquitin-like protease family profile domain-containing protein n=1 Tax=Dendrobium chrysotoxum TaxID=161865 RepID=A0AAV7GIQ0_DENCH|nr:hypothetical protein IEQ34_014248 [Dendrobium chrysotoxum]